MQLIIVLSLIIIVLALFLKLNDKFNWFKLSTAEKKFLYRKNNHFLTDAERNFFLVLKQVCDRNNLIVFSKVRLADLFFIPGNNRSSFLKVSQKHADFVLCELNHIDPVCVIELDDSSHQSQSRQSRDEFVEKVFISVNLPLIRIKNSYNYNVQELENKIKEVVK